MKKLFKKIVNWFRNCMCIARECNVENQKNELEKCSDNCNEDIIDTNESSESNDQDVSGNNGTGVNLDFDYTIDRINTIVEEIKTTIDTNISVFDIEHLIFSMPIEEFINNKIKDISQYFISSDILNRHVYVSLPVEYYEKYNVTLKAIYDDGSYIIRNGMLTETDPFVLQFDDFSVLSEEKCYMVKLVISIINKEDKRKHYDLDVTPIYEYNIHQLMNPIDYIDLYNDIEYTNEIKQVTILEYSAYRINKEELVPGKVFIHPMPENGDYMIRTYNSNNNIIDDRKITWSKEESYFDYHEEVTKVVIYKLSDKNVDAVTIYIK